MADPLQRCPVEPCLTVSEVAAVLRCSVPTVHQLVRRGELPAVAFGRRTVIHRADLEAFLESHRLRPESLATFRESRRARKSG